MRTRRPSGSSGSLPARAAPALAAAAATQRAPPALAARPPAARDARRRWARPPKRGAAAWHGALPPRGPRSSAHRHRNRSSPGPRAALGSARFCSARGAPPAPPAVPEPRLRSSPPRSRRPLPGARRGPSRPRPRCPRPPRPVPRAEVPRAPPAAPLAAHPPPAPAQPFVAAPGFSQPRPGLQMAPARRSRGSAARPAPGGGERRAARPPRGLRIRAVSRLQPRARAPSAPAPAPSRRAAATHRRGSAGGCRSLGRDGRAGGGCGIPGSRRGTLSAPFPQPRALEARAGEKQKVFADVGVGQRRPRAGDTIKGATHRLQAQPSGFLRLTALQPSLPSSLTPTRRPGGCCLTAYTVRRYC